MTDFHDKLITRLDALAAQHDGLEAQLADPAVVADHERVRELSVRRAALASTVELYRQ